MKEFPALFIERLRQTVPSSYFEEVMASFVNKKSVVMRINTLKAEPEKVIDTLSGLEFTTVPWCDHALVFDRTFLEALGKTDLIKNGVLYQQGLSSLLVARILNPQPNEDVLDLCSAPGSKTTQMAAMMRNTGHIAAVEHARARFYKLKSVIRLLGVENAQCHLMDGRKFSPLGVRWLPEKRGGQRGRDDKYRATFEGFDKVLVDAPCSSEGRFDLTDPKTFAYWSPRKIKEMKRKQKGLVLNAFRLLKPGGCMVYSTCTFAAQENEEVIDWILRKAGGMARLSDIHIDGIRRYPALLSWENKEYDPEIEKCLRILPDGRMQGFFIAKINKLGRDHFELTQ